MNRITLNFNLQPGQDALGALLRAANDMAPAYKDIGEYMVPATQRRFETGTAPDGSKWKPNSALTLSRKKGNKPGIGETRVLSTLIHHEATADSLTIGSSRGYAATFHFGALQGAFGRSKRGGPLPWGNIPGREFLGVSAEEQIESLAILADHFRPGAGG